MPLGGVNTVIRMNANPKLLAMCLIALMIFSAAVVLYSGEEVAADPDPIPGAHDGHEGFEAWSNNSSLPTSGTYYLTGKVNLNTNVLNLTGDLILCLNGYDIGVYNSGCLSVSGGTLTICECNTSIHRYGYFNDSDMFVTSEDPPPRG